MPRPRLLSGKAHLALMDHERAWADLRWAARCVAVHRGRVRPEEDWPSALSPASRAIAGEAVVLLGLLAIEEGNRAASALHRDLARRLSEGPALKSFLRLEEALR